MGRNDFTLGTAKRTIDILGAICLGFICSPLLGIIAAAIKLLDGGPILHRRRVVGTGGSQFDALKFRTMVENADELLANDSELWDRFQRNYKLEHDPRISRIGGFLRRLSLDELPQLYNVLKGQMSLVGPRMVAPEELEKYGSWKYERIRTKPGITGYWQVNGRQTVGYEERIAMDKYYLKHRSLWLDFKILLKTAAKVLKREGAT